MNTSQLKLEVPPTGPQDAPIYLLGGIPGEWERRALQPFVGPAGRLLAEWLSAVGLNRSDCRMDYLCRTPRGEKAEIERGARLLPKRLAKLSPRLVVPIGTQALRACLGKPLWGGDGPRISDWRGSVCRMGGEPEGLPVLPMYPAEDTFQTAKLAQLCLADWAKAARLVRELKAGKALELPQRTHVIEPSKKRVREFEARLVAAYEASPKGSRLSFDIETNPRERIIICIGFSVDAEFSITLAWSKWQRTIRRWLEHPIGKVTQNGAYDNYWLAMHGIRVRNWKDDTLAMHHCLRPHFPHALAVQASLYTMEPYWKSSPKDEDNLKAMRTPYRALARYNGQDVCVTWELWKRHLEELRSDG